MVVEEEEEEEEEENEAEEKDAFGNLTHLRSNACLQFKDALGTAASTPLIRWCKATFIKGSFAKCRIAG